MAFDTKGERLISGSRDGITKLWSLAWPDRDALTFPLNPAALGPRGNRFIAPGENGAQIRDTVTGSAIGQPFHPVAVDETLAERISSIAISPDGARVFVGTNRETGQVWDALTLQPLGKPISYQGRIRDADFSPDGSLLVVASEDGHAQIWNVETGTPVGPPLVQGQHSIAAAFSPDGSRVLTGGYENTAQLWHLDASKDGPPIRFDDHVQAVAFSPDGKTIATACNRTGQLWDRATRQALGTALQHPKALRAIAFHPDPRRHQVLTGSLDGKARLWDVKTGKQIGPPLAHSGSIWRASFSADGSKILLSGGSSVTLLKCPPAPTQSAGLERLKLWIEVITGSELDFDAGGRLKVLDAESWQSRRRRLEKLGGPPG